MDNILRQTMLECGVREETVNILREEEVKPIIVMFFTGFLGSFMFPTKLKRGFVERSLKNCFVFISLFNLVSLTVNIVMYFRVWFVWRRFDA